MSKFFCAGHANSAYQARLTVGAVLVLFLGILSSAARVAPAQDEALQAATQAYDRYDYANAVQLLQAALKKEPQSSEIYLMLSKNYYEMEQWDAAITNAERAVAIHPDNSSNHEWLGRAYGRRLTAQADFPRCRWPRKHIKNLKPRSIWMNETSRRHRGWWSSIAARPELPAAAKIRLER